MKMLALVTYTGLECSNKWRSFAATGDHEIVVHQYDQYPAGQHRPLVDLAKSVNPDFILYIGAPGPYHGRPVPDPATLRAINAVAPMIHMCDDAADHPWWPILEEYDREKCFTVQVAIDGGGISPIKRFRNGLTLLTPIDPRPFKPEPWDQRISFRMAVMVGGMGHGERGAVMNHLIQRGLLEWHGGQSMPYEGLAEVMCRHKIALNHPMTGTGQRMHVKGRVIEAGFAGCCLLERAGSPTAQWFIPGINFFEYETPDDAERLINTLDDAFACRVAANFHRRVVEEHHPRVFWNKVLTAVRELR